MVKNDIESNEEFDEEDFDLEDDYRRYPIQNQTEMDNKIISTHAKSKMVFINPKFEIVEAGIPLLDENKQIIYVDADVGGIKKKVPVLKKIVSTRMRMDFERKELDFPIMDWFNDSVPSSTLTKEEGRYIRRIDDLGGKLGIKMLKQPEKLQIAGFLYRLYYQRNSLADTGKGIGGAGVESAKKTISKAESSSRLYRLDRDELDEYRARKEEVSKGAFGFGIDIPIIGKI